MKLKVAWSSSLLSQHTLTLSHKGSISKLFFMNHCDYLTHNKVCLKNAFILKTTFYKKHYIMWPLTFKDFCMRIYRCISWSFDYRNQCVIFLYFCSDASSSMLCLGISLYQQNKVIIFVSLFVSFFLLHNFRFSLA